MFGDSNITIEQLYARFLEVDVVVTDSRVVRELVESGKRVIFFCLRGDNFNGNDFIDDVLRDGASWVLTDSQTAASSPHILKTHDVLLSMQQLANFHRRRMRAKFIALTGSNGKTTTKELLSGVLSKKYNVLSTKGNLNNHIGVPLTILSVNDSHDIAIIEQGANHKGEIALLSSISEPDYGLITNIGKAHLDGFAGVDGIIKGKGELFDFLQSSGGVAFYNSDLNHLSEMIAQRDGLKSIAYNSSIITKNPLSTIEGISFNYENRVIITHLSGDYNLLNIVSAIAVGRYFGVDSEDITDAISQYVPQNMRSQVITTESNRVVVDAYNANPSSMQCALENFDGFAAVNRCYILGQMNELGDYSLDEHTNLVRAVDSVLKNSHSAIAIFVGSEFGGLIAGDKMLWFETVVDLQHYLKENRLKGYDILLKGSRGVGLEKIMSFL